MKGETEMGFNNGYESGYSDALEDVRNGKVAGLGPASGGGGVIPAARAPKIFTLANSVGDGAVGPITSASISGRLDATADMDFTMFSAHISIAGPAGGFVTGDIVGLYCALDNFRDDCSVTIGGSDVTSMLDLTGATTILVYDGSSFGVLIHTSI